MDQDSQYSRKRAQDERTRTAASDRPEVRMAHQQLAELHERRVRAAAPIKLQLVD